MKRNRLSYFVIGCFVVALGLASRQYTTLLPTLVARYAGDTLWAGMVFVGIGFLTPERSSFRVAVAALVMCYLVEFSQIYQAPWIGIVRQTRVGGLILGYGFLWSDVACYTVGVTVALALELAVWRLSNGEA